GADHQHDQRDDHADHHQCLHVGLAVGDVLVGEAVDPADDGGQHERQRQRHDDVEGRERRAEVLEVESHVVLIRWFEGWAGRWSVRARAVTGAGSPVPPRRICSGEPRRERGARPKASTAWQYFDTWTTDMSIRAVRSVAQYGTRSLALSSTMASFGGMMKRFCAPEATWKSRSRPCTRWSMVARRPRSASRPMKASRW